MAVGVAAGVGLRTFRPGAEAVPVAGLVSALTFAPETKSVVVDIGVQSLFFKRSGVAVSPAGSVSAFPAAAPGNVIVQDLFNFGLGAVSVAKSAYGPGVESTVVDTWVQCFLFKRAGAVILAGSVSAFAAAAPGTGVTQDLLLNIGARVVAVDGSVSAAVVDGDEVQCLLFKSGAVVSARATSVPASTPVAEVQRLLFKSGDVAPERAGSVSAPTPVAEVQRLLLKSGAEAPARAGSVSASTPVAEVQRLLLKSGAVAPGGAGSVSPPTPVVEFRLLFLKNGIVSRVGAGSASAPTPAPETCVVLALLATTPFNGAFGAAVVWPDAPA